VAGPGRLTIDRAEPAGERGAEQSNLLRVTGELDMNTSGQLRQALSSIPNPGRVVVDLSGLSFCDSSGLSALLAGHKHLAAAGGQLVLSAVPPRIQKVLELTGLVEVFAFAGPGA
jgi:anti-sigma B factor antagonist